MEGKTVEERAKLGYVVLHRAQDLIKVKYSGLQLFWKREWKPRRSGRIQGELCPHYHFMAYCSAWTDEQYFLMFIHVARQWIRYAKTLEVEKALKVAMHEKSFGYLKENDPYASYFAKYVAKGSTIEGEGIGRFWGMIGPVEQAEGEDHKLTARETIQLKRSLRRFLHSRQKRRKKLKDGSMIMVRPKRRYVKALRNERFSGFVATHKTIVQRFLDSD